MNSSSLRRMRWLAAIFTLVLAGCGQARYPHTEVVGEVILDGEPAPAVNVLFTAKSCDKNTPATFSAEAIEGSFLFDLHDGPPPGEYEVIVKPVEPDSEAVAAELLANQNSLIQDRNQFLAAAGKKGAIRVELSADDVNEVVIELTNR